MFYHFEKRLNHTHIVTCLIENFQVKLKAIDTQDRKKRKCNLYLAEHGEILDAFVIISNEIHHFMSMLSELLSVHRLQFIIPADSKINHRLTETKINSRNPYNGVKEGKKKKKIRRIEKAILEFNVHDLHFSARTSRNGVRKIRE